MREDLLGYLLGALEPDEMERVERALQQDPRLRDQLRQIQRMLEPLDEDRPEAMFEPPPDLTARTLDWIDAVAPLSPSPGAETPWVTPADHHPAASGDPDLASSDASGRARPSGGSATRLQTATDPPRSVSANASPWSWPDSLASSLAVFALIGLILPAILRGRFEARKLVCQDHLRQLGLGMTAYAMSDPAQQLPQLATEGPEAFAGVYAVRLHGANWIDQPSTLWCPSTDRPQLPPALPPTLEQLHAATPSRLITMQRAAGGSFAYNLGVRDGGRYHSPRYRARTTFAILGDAPVFLAGGTRAQIPHNQLGVNLLYEDGHVAFVPHDALHTVPDPPFVNHHGAVEAGVHIDDAALAPSQHPPFTHVRQR